MEDAKIWKAIQEAEGDRETKRRCTACGLHIDMMDARFSEVCKNCWMCVECAGKSIFENEGLCSGCVYDVATWALLKLEHHRLLDKG